MEDLKRYHRSFVTPDRISLYELKVESASHAVRVLRTLDDLVAPSSIPAKRNSWRYQSNPASRNDQIGRAHV